MAGIFAGDAGDHQVLQQTNRPSPQRRGRLVRRRGQKQGAGQLRFHQHAPLEDFLPVGHSPFKYVAETAQDAAQHHESKLLEQIDSNVPHMRRASCRRAVLAHYVSNQKRAAAGLLALPSVLGATAETRDARLSWPTAYLPKMFLGPLRIGTAAATLDVHFSGPLPFAAHRLRLSTQAACWPGQQARSAHS